MRGIKRTLRINRVLSLMLCIAVVTLIAASVFSEAALASFNGDVTSAVRISSTATRGSATIAVNPAQLSDAGDVTISITITNSNQPTMISDPDNPGSTIADPDAGAYTSVSISNSYGVAFNAETVRAGESKTFDGVMHVTNSQIGVELSFTVTWVDGGQTVTNPLSVIVVRADTAYLKLTRSVDRTTAAPGEKITLTYVLVNTGSVPLDDIKLVDRFIAGTSNPMITPFSLQPGERKEYIHTYTMGSSTVVSEPVASFTPANGGSSFSTTVSPITLGLINAQLTKEVTMGKPTPDGVMLTLYLTNNGNQRLTGLTIKDELGNSVGSGSFTLAIGESKVIDHFIPNPSSPRNVVFYISGTNSSGTRFNDNTKISVVRPYIDTSLLGLKFTASINTPVNSERVIGITFNITNTGSLSYLNLSLTEQSINHDLHTIDVLEPGKPVSFDLDFTVGAETELIFELTAHDSSGNSYVFDAYISATGVDGNSIIANSPPPGGSGVSTIDDGNLGGKLDGLLTEFGEKLKVWLIVLSVIAGLAVVAIITLMVAERSQKSVSHK